MLLVSGALTLPVPPLNSGKIPFFTPFHLNQLEVNRLSCWDPARYSTFCSGHKEMPGDKRGTAREAETDNQKRAESQKQRILKVNTVVNRDGAHRNKSQVWREGQTDR